MNLGRRISTTLNKRQASRLTNTFPHNAQQISMIHQQRTRPSPEQSPRRATAASAPDTPRPDPDRAPFPPAASFVAHQCLTPGPASSSHASTSNKTSPPPHRVRAAQLLYLLVRQQGAHHGTPPPPDGACSSSYRCGPLPSIVGLWDEAVPDQTSPQGLLLLLQPFLPFPNR